MGEQRMSVGDAALKGALAGLIGGAAMAAAMKAEQLLLPAGSQADMPPVELVETEAEKAGVSLSQPQALAAGMAAHMGYSALLGATYGVVQSRLHAPTLLHGLLFGTLAYAAGYAKGGIMPRTGTMPPPTQQPLERAVLPPAAHAVFGLTTAEAFAQLA